jgi:uncharacterized protein YjbJ (UPF0337 family)
MKAKRAPADGEVRVGPWRCQSEARGQKSFGPCLIRLDEQVPSMNKDQKGGAAQNVKGRLKEVAGIVSGNKKMEADGLADRVAGAAKAVVGAAKHGAAKKLDR